MQEFILPEGLQNIPDGTFYDCDSLNSINLPQGIKSIGRYAFCRSGLKAIDIPAGVNSIGSYAFYGCSLSSIKLPTGIKTIEAYTFMSCDALTGITFPDALTTIGIGAFSDCDAFTTIVLPEAVTTIGDKAFSGCKGLTTMILPDAVTNIGDEAFSQCVALTTMVLGPNVGSIGAKAFANCAMIKDFYCYAQVVPKTSADAFQSSFVDYATLHVPEVSISSYQAETPWSEFGEIIALTGEETGIESTESKAKRPLHYYTPNGLQMATPCKGLNIVRHADGTTTKIIRR